MFGLGNKNKKAKPATNEEQIKQIDDSIRIMPQKFYVAPPKKGILGVILLVVLGVMILAGVAFGSWYLVSLTAEGNETEPLSVNETNVNVNENVNQNVNSGNSNINSNLNSNSAIATSTPIDVTPTSTNSNLNANSNNNLNSNSNINSNNSSTEIPMAADVDNDLLTDVEEALYGTDSALADTDGDGFPDGSELLSGYDPTRAGATTAETGLLRSYNHDSYTIVYPNEWRLREDDNGNEVFFTASNGEFIQILRITNARDETLSEWYQRQFSSDQSDNLTSVRLQNGNITGFRTSNNQIYYLVDSSDHSVIYILTYNSGNSTALNFVTTFSLMVRSFNLVP